MLREPRKVEAVNHLSPSPLEEREGNRKVPEIRWITSTRMGKINGTPASPVYIGRLPQPQVVGRDNPATIDDDHRSTAAGGGSRSCQSTRILDAKVTEGPESDNPIHLTLVP